jgi:DNA-binding transcriptional LysR family regulator
MVAAFGAEAYSPVALTAYPQLTFDENGERCGWRASDDLATRLRNLPGVSTREMTWAGDTVTGALQMTMSVDAAAHGWIFVDAHVAAFERHGYCSTEGWLVRIPESPLVEGSPYGAVHPNNSGQVAYANAVLQTISVPEPNGLVGGLAALALLVRRRRSKRRDS